MTPEGQNELSRRIAGLIDDIAGHTEAAEAIAAMGESAIPGIRAYLAGGSQAIPQTRCFAVAMLARMHAAAATRTLRGVLRAHPLKTLPPPFWESEYVVKSDALEALAVRSYPELADDIEFGLHERLRAAAAEAGRQGLQELADALVDLLDDDVLAEAAMSSLVTLGQAACTAISPRLDAWLTGAAISARRRLALIRALRVLRRVGFSGPDVIRRALDDPHPAVRAAAALLWWPERCSDAIVVALLHGALGFDRGLANDCRTALDRAGGGLIESARRALQRNAEPDLYGQIQPLSSQQRGWLKRFMAAKGDNEVRVPSKHTGGA